MMKGVSGADVDLSPSTVTLGDPSAASPSVRPTPGAVTWATNGMGRASASGAAAVVPGYDPSITTAATFAYIDGVMTGYVMPAMVGATSMVSSGIMVITGCSTTSEGTP